jgi:hypothetical protein
MKPPRLRFWYANRKDYWLLLRTLDEVLRFPQTAVSQRPDFLDDGDPVFSSAHQHEIEAAVPACCRGRRCMGVARQDRQVGAQIPQCIHPLGGPSLRRPNRYGRLSVGALSPPRGGDRRIGREPEYQQHSGRNQPRCVAVPDICRKCCRRKHDEECNGAPGKPHLNHPGRVAAGTGRGAAIRTRDLLYPIQVRYQAALHPDGRAPGRWGQRHPIYVLGGTGSKLQPGRNRAEVKAMTTDIAGPMGAVEPGMTVEVLPRSNASSVVSGGGVLAEVSGFSVFVQTAECPWSPGDYVIVACGPLGNRVGALARFREQRGERAVFIRQSPWRPLNRRAFERFPAELAAQWTAGSEWKPGIVADVSHGGLALVVTSEPGPGFIRVRLEAGTATTTMVANIVGRSGTVPAAILHLEFEHLSAETGVFLGDLLDRLATLLGTAEAPQ